MVDHKFDLKRFQLSKPINRPEMRKTRPPRHQMGEKFLKGPIPWNWLALAGQLPGKALHVGMTLWWWAGVTGFREIALSVTKMSELGVSRFAAYRALKCLEGAGLVEVKRHPGRKPIVIILEATELNFQKPNGNSE